MIGIMFFFRAYNKIVSMIIPWILVDMVNLTSFKPFTAYFRERLGYKTISHIMMPFYDDTVIIFIRVVAYQYVIIFYIPNPSKIADLIIRIVGNNPPFLIL